MALARHGAVSAAAVITGALRNSATAPRAPNLAVALCVAGPSQKPASLHAQQYAVRCFSATSTLHAKNRPGEGKEGRIKQRKRERLERAAKKMGEEGAEVVVTRQERQRLPFLEAVKLLHAVEAVRPLNAFELHIVTNVRSNQSNALRGRLALPKEPRTRPERILIFAEDGSDSRDVIARLQSSNASLQDSLIVGGQEMIQEIVQNRDRGAGANFTKVLSTEVLLPQVSRALARSLGPRGLMPSLKRGTVARSAGDMEKAIREAQGAVDWRSDRNGVVRAAIGRINFTAEELKTNITAFLHVILNKIHSGLSSGSAQSGIVMSTGRAGEMKAADVKRSLTTIKQVHLSSTQGPAVLLELPELL